MRYPPRLFLEPDSCIPSLVQSAHGTQAGSAGGGDQEAESLKATGTCDDTPNTVPFPDKSDKQNDKRVAVSSQIITPHRPKDGDRLILSPQARAVKP